MNRRKGSPPFIIFVEGCAGAEAPCSPSSNPPLFMVCRVGSSFSAFGVGVEDPDDPSVPFIDMYPFALLPLIILGESDDPLLGNEGD